jgi:hypothetical protein
MLKGNIKVSKGHESEPGFQAAIPQHPYRRRSPKREMQAGRSNMRAKKGPLEHKG